MQFSEKRGQVAIFAIIALVIVAIILVVLFATDVKIPGLDNAPADPQQYLRSCLEPFLKSEVERLSQQGGYSQPLGFIIYNDTKIPYLCYTSEYYKTCIVQQSDVQGHFEKELTTFLQPKAKECLQDFKEDFQKQGYSVTTGNSEVSVSFVPEQIRISLDAPITVSKEFTRTYNSMDLSLPSQLYEILAISTSIVDFESTYGDSETTLYIGYYPNIKIQKTKIDDGSKIYTVSNVMTKEQFTFASRSLAWPAGYGGSIV